MEEDSFWEEGPSGPRYGVERPREAAVSTVVVVVGEFEVTERLTDDNALGGEEDIGRVGLATLSTEWDGFWVGITEELEDKWGRNDSLNCD